MRVMSDKFDPWVLALSTLGSTALATFVLRGVLSNKFAGVLAFGTVYGTFAGGRSSGFLQPIASAYNSMLLCRL